MRLVILAAGQGFQLDGFNKITLKHPISRKTILDYYLEFFPGFEVTVVVGYKAITIMNEYPQLDYVYNSEWRTKGNSYSLALALDERPCIVLPSDFFLDKELADSIRTAKGNRGLISPTENRSQQALHCSIQDHRITDVYDGRARSGDPELMGVFKIEDPRILRTWRRNCLSNTRSSAFIGENLPLHEFEIETLTASPQHFHEINTPVDYVSFLESKRVAEG